MYRYFYNTQGHIVGESTYKVFCLITSQCDSIGYIDSETKIDRNQYHVDLTTLTLVSNNQ